MRNRLAVIAATFAASLMGASAAHASDCGPGIFQMADGRWYHFASGTSAYTCANLLNAIPAAPEAETPPEAPAAPEAAPAAAGTVRSAVERAKAMLAARIEELNAGKKPEIVATYDVWIDITLAVWDPGTDAVTLVEAKKNGFRIEAPIPIKVKRNNGVNSEFLLEDPDDVVVGVRYPIFRNVTVNAKKPRYQLEDVVYVPYSSKLHTPETVAWGKEMLDANVEKAYAEFRAMGLRSRAFPDRLLVDVITPEQLEAIAIIEHLSEGSLLGANGRLAMESVYVVLGANQDDAYAYSRSSAGAKGLFQFIPSTYKLMIARKELKLDPDFETGMATPVNAIKAAVAYLDAELAGMPLAVKDLFAVDRDRVIEYLAAAYNGGGTRIRRAVTMWGDAWSEPHAAEISAAARKHGASSLTVTRMKNATLRDETISYVKKLRQTLAMLRPSPLARR